ncbi:ABC transporter permease [Microbacterium sp.]|uniref:ABC transporter permease n=1 Tax=Microbacterium sp. TaxID=51671 RepID=UPI003C78EC41
MFAQTAHGLRQSILIALIVSIGSTVLAAVIGACAAYFRGRTEQIILAIIHFLMIMPTFLVLSLISNKAGGDWLVIALVMTAISWFLGARTVWAIALSVREQEYVAAARYMGVPGFRIVLRHIIPNIGSLLVISFTLGLVGAVMAETGLSFIGFGVKTPDVSLGSLIGSGSNTVTSAPWLFYYPAGVLTLLTVSMAFVADGLRDALDPTSNSGGTA